MATNRLAGRSTAGDGAVEEVAVGARLTLAAGELNATTGSVITGITGAFAITNIIGISQENYDNLPVKDLNTQYNIVE
jgi:hypothetical protein